MTENRDEESPFEEGNGSGLPDEISGEPDYISIEKRRFAKHRTVPEINVECKKCKARVKMCSSIFKAWRHGTVILRKPEFIVLITTMIKEHGGQMVCLSETTVNPKEVLRPYGQPHPRRR